MGLSVILYFRSTIQRLLSCLVGDGGPQRETVKQDSKNPQHRRHQGTTGGTKTIQEAQDRNGGLGAMLKTILEAAAILLLVLWLDFG